jgi:hypothetical protein
MTSTGISPNSWLTERENPLGGEPEKFNYSRKILN